MEVSPTKVITPTVSSDSSGSFKFVKKEAAPKEPLKPALRSEGEKLLIKLKTKLNRKLMKEQGEKLIQQQIMDFTDTFGHQTIGEPNYRYKLFQ